MVKKDYQMVSCECKRSPTYEESMIKDQVIAGLYNKEIQKDLISHEECETFSLEKMLKFLEGKESGEQDASVMASARVNKVDQKRLSKPDERFKKQLPNKQNQEPRVCGSCGYREHEDKSKCPTRTR